MKTVCQRTTLSLNIFVKTQNPDQLDSQKGLVTVILLDRLNIDFILLNGLNDPTHNGSKVVYRQCTMAKDWLS